LLLSILLIEMLLVTLALVRRWLVIAARRIAIERVQRRRALALQQGDISPERESFTLEPEKPDLEAIGEQSRRLINFLLILSGAVGLWFIWIDVLPALNFLHRFPIWPNTEDTGTSITFGHLIGFSVTVFVTVLATRNIPGLLEITVLSHLPVDAANRYASIAICRYLIAITGLIVAFNSIGISWESYQWLVAAGTVGLGFGLQEIFANFVSGLIVLFEQPIRVGDVVTIGDITGVVSKIRMRATTVTNWDRKEYIVPNKEFITGRLLNWTLSNSVNRVVVTVGVAYGTDPDQARQILLEIARKHPYVLSDPAPSVTFEEFGDSTLNITLRCFLPDLENRLATLHDLNTAAQRELNAVGIQFAFPTRELYVRSSQGLS
jgi:potassium-dependent mechanosensitive channel